MQKQRHALVVGGAGFIGSNLCRLLLEQGMRVDCADNLITGRLESIQPLRSIEGFRFLRVDITDHSFVNMALSQPYHEIYHLACPTGVPNISRLGEEMVRTCSIGTENVLRVASSHNSTVVFASSAEIYGDPEQFPQGEDYAGNVDPVGPRSAYEEGKRFGESLVRLYARKYQLDAKIARIFNTFGIGMRTDDSRVIPSFLRCLSEGRRLTVYGDGHQTRTHLYVADLLDGLRIVARLGKRGEAYNLGGNVQLSILELIDIIRSLTSAELEVEHVPHFIPDHGGRLPQIDKAKALGWSPRISIHEGLRRMLDSQKESVETRLPERNCEVAPRARRRAL